jgi:protein phosphatase
MAGHRRLSLDVGQFSDVGRQRSHNEDWLGLFQPTDEQRIDSKGSLFVVADGMGGHQSGEMASRIAVDRAIRAYVDDPASDVGASLRRAIETANRALVTGSPGRGGSSQKRDWGTTMVAAVIHGDELWVANVGDSRAYLLRDGRLRQLSHDHSLAAGVGGGQIRGIGRHVITRALGRKPEVEVDLFAPVGLRDGDRLLLCSDGLSGPVAEEEIGAIAGRFPVQRAVERLVRAANEKGGADNISAILVEVVAGRPVSRRQALQEFAETWLRPAVWQNALHAFARSLPRGAESLRSPLVILLAALAALLLIGLGVVVGLNLFGR